MMVPPSGSIATMSRWHSPSASLEFDAFLPRVHPATLSKSSVSVGLALGDPDGDAEGRILGLAVGRADGVVLGDADGTGVGD